MTAVRIEQTIGSRIRAERRARGWTGDDLARKSCGSKSFISEVENAKTSVSIGTLTRLLAPLGLRIDIVEPDENRVCVGLHPAAVKLLDKLAAGGMHGLGREGVAQRLIEDGLRREALK